MRVFSRDFCFAAAIAASLIATPAMAQLSPPANVKHKQETTGQASSQPSTTKKVEDWTKKEWNAAKAKWAKNKTAWRSCNAQAKKEKLSGRKSWSFIYDCMTKA